MGNNVGGGKMMLSGPGTLISVGNRIGVGAIGPSPTSEMIVEDGAEVRTQDFRVGGQSAGGGELVLRTGARLFATTFTVGWQTTGLTSISDAGTFMELQTLALGRQAAGDGILHLVDGGLITTFNVTIGHEGHGQLFVTGAGAELSVANQLAIGLSPTGAATSQGALTIAAGGRVDVGGNMYIGGYTTGTAEISDAQLRVAGLLVVGTETGADGRLDVGSGAQVDVGGNVIVSNAGAAEVAISGTGATVTVSGGISVAQADATATGGRGELAITDDAFVSSSFVAFGAGQGALEVARGATLETGQVSGVGGVGSLFRLDGGTLRLNQDQSLLFDGLGYGDVDLGPGGGTIDTQRFDATSWADFTGGGSLTKTGTGTFSLGVASTYTGATFIEQGTFAARGANFLSPSSLFSVMPNGTLALGGFDQTISALENAGTVDFGPGAGTTLAVDTYTGLGGTLIVSTVLGEDSAITDRLIVTDTIGTGTIVVRNAGGMGAQTIEGIKIVDVTNVSGGTFKLKGDYTFQGAPAVVGGAFAYRLYQGGVSTPADGDWYLRSTLLASPAPNDILYQPGVPLYETYSQVLQQLNRLPTLQQRVGHRFRGGGGGAQQHIARPDTAPTSNDVWGRLEVSRQKALPANSTSGARYDLTSALFNAGFENQFYTAETGALFAGLTVQAGHGSAAVKSVFGDGRIDTAAYGVGLTLTWYGDNGFYVDGQARLNRFDSDLSSKTAATDLVDNNRGFGFASGIEVGQRVSVGSGWSVTPQAQLMFSTVDFDSFSDVWNAPVSLVSNDSLIGRLGLGIEHASAWRSSDGTLNRSLAYGIFSLYRDFEGKSTTQVALERFTNQAEDLWGGIGLGGSYSFDDEKYTIYGEGLVSASFNDPSANHTTSLKVGIRSQF